jgi:glycosyltransferase involved in cell wall biosynthesis
MRVIHVAPTGFGYGGVYGGGERYPLELARALSTRVDCTLVTFGREERQFADGRLHVRVVRPLGYVGGHPARAIAPSLPRALVGADVIHAHHVRSPMSLFAAVLGRLRGVGTAVTDHGLQGFPPVRPVAPLYDRFLLVSRYSRAELGAPSGRTRVIYGGVDPSRYRPDPSARRRGVLFVGRMTPHKGVDRLISALPAGTPLTVVGSGGHDPRAPESGYPSLLRRLALGRDVRFAGAVEDAELARLYGSAQVLALPSVEVTCYGRRIAVSELLGLVILEAMASGTPVVASRLGGIPEIVEHGVTGFLVEPGNERELCEALTEVVSNDALARSMGAAARQRVLDEFTWDRCAERCLDAYASLAKNR